MILPFGCVSAEFVSRFEQDCINSTRRRTQPVSENGRIGRIAFRVSVEVVDREPCGRVRCIGDHYSVHFKPDRRSGLTLRDGGY